MKTEYDEELPPLPPGKKRTKAERRAIANRKARSIPCGGCNHSRPDHIALTGRERTLFVWCPVCSHKCEKEKWNAKLI
jgi:hypothetical protein